MQAATEFYGNGDSLPEMHPDSETDREIIIAALSARLDIARTILGKVSAMQVVTPELVQLKREAVWALSETDPRTLCDTHHNNG